MLKDLGITGHHDLSRLLNLGLKEKQNNYNLLIVVRNI